MITALIPRDLDYNDLFDFDAYSDTYGDEVYVDIWKSIYGTLMKEASSVRPDVLRAAVGTQSRNSNGKSSTPEAISSLGNRRTLPLDRLPDWTSNAHKRPDNSSSLVAESDGGGFWPSSAIGASTALSQTTGALSHEDEVMSDSMTEEVPLQSPSFTAYREPLITLSPSLTSKEMFTRGDNSPPSKRVRTQDALENQQPDATAHSGSSSSKACRADAISTIHSLTKKASKRAKQTCNGYPCRSGCGHVFNRSCDEKKHYERTHAPITLTSHRHRCPECEAVGKVKRFLYPKDVRRHLKQVHHMSWQDVATVIDSGAPLQAFEPQDSTPSTVFTLWALVTALCAFKRLAKRARRRPIGGSPRSTRNARPAKQKNSYPSAQGASRNAVRNLPGTGSVTSANIHLATPRNITRSPPSGMSTVCTVLLAVCRFKWGLKQVRVDSAGGITYQAHRAKQNSSNVSARCVPRDAVGESSGTGSVRPNVHLASPLVTRPSHSSGEHYIAKHCSRTSRATSLPRESRLIGDHGLTLDLARADSAPPDDGARTHTTGNTLFARANYAQRTTATLGVQQDSGHKRFIAHSRCNGIDRDDDDEGDVERGRPSKRQKEDGCRSPKRFACIFHVGPDSVLFADHTTKYQYLSQLLRHLESHSFYICSNCFTTFQNAADRDSHKHYEQTRCYKACRNKGCRRSCPAGSIPPPICLCIKSPEQQWSAVFAAKYPNIAVPAISDEAQEPSTSPVNGNRNGVHSNTANDLQNYDLVNFSWKDFSADPNGFVFDDIEGITTSLPSTESEDDQTFANSDQPSPRITNAARLDDLKMVVMNLWQELQDLAPARTRPKSALWLIMHKLAPNLLLDAEPAESGSSPIPLDALESEKDLEIVVGRLWQKLGDIAPGRTKEKSSLWEIVHRCIPGILNQDSSG